MKGKTKITFYGNCLFGHLTPRLKSYRKETKHTWLCCTNFWLRRTIFL